jgi:hypothetical protein
MSDRTSNAPDHIRRRIAASPEALAMLADGQVELGAPMTGAERRRLYGMTMPASVGEPVCQGHADWCAEYGHATWTVDGVEQGTCPRCGEVTEPTRRLSRGSRILADPQPAGGQVHAEASVSHPDGLPPTVCLYVNEIDAEHASTYAVGPYVSADFARKLGWQLLEAADEVMRRERADEARRLTAI